MSTCALSEGAGVVRGVLRSVDCQVQQTAEAGYRALTGPQSVFPLALTAILTIYIAVLGYGLMFGASRVTLRQAPLIALKIGLVLSLTLNWTVFQTLVFDVAMKAPLEIARTVARPSERSGAVLAGDPLGGLQVVYDQLGAAASTFGKLAGPNPQALRGGEAATADGLWKAQAALFTSTVGLISIAIIAVGVLTALGPVFISLGLFESTRGLFVGWLRAVVAAAMLPAVNWIASVIMLIIIEPPMIELARGAADGAPSLNTAASVGGAVLIFSMAQVVLAVAMVVLASGFQLRPRSEKATAAGESTPSDPAVVRSRAEILADSLRRQAIVSARRPAGPIGVTANTGSSQAVGRRDVARPSDWLSAATPYRRSSGFDRLRNGRGRRS